MSHDRTVEWLLAAQLVAFGSTLVALPQAFLSPFLQGFSQDIIGDDPAGFIMIAVGLSWVAGLWINGSWRRSPSLRLACAIAGAGMFGVIEVGITLSQPTTGTGTYGVLLAFSFFTVARSANDVGQSYRRKTSRREPRP